MRCADKARSANANPTAYATAEDFRRIRNNEMESLSQLAYLLTADRRLAARCVLTGLEEAARSTRVFKTCAKSWAKRAVVKKAISELRPRSWTERSPQEGPLLRAGARVALSTQASLASHRILQLETFDRFVFVLSMLEKYSDQDCALLLGCTSVEVRRAAAQAQEQITAAQFVDDAAGALTV